MKRLFLTFLLALAAVSAGARTWRTDEVPNVQFADRTRYVSDPDGILSSAAVTRIDHHHLHAVGNMLGGRNVRPNGRDQSKQ